VLAVLGAMLVNTVLTNDGFRWDVVGRYLFSGPVLNGLRNTLVLTVLAMLIGIVGGVALAVMRLSPNPLASSVAGLYIWLFRGTPLIAQLLFWNFLAALYPRLSLGVPFGPEFVSFDTDQLINQFTTFLLGLGLNEASYMAEIVRGGRTSRAGAPLRRLPQPALRRPAATRGDHAGVRDAAAADAVRRADLGAGTPSWWVRCST
jgi:polar amino acid transport system permease protein